MLASHASSLPHSPTLTDGCRSQDLLDRYCNVNIHTLTNPTNKISIRYSNYIVPLTSNSHAHSYSAPLPPPSPPFPLSDLMSIWGAEYTYVVWGRRGGWGAVAAHGCLVVQQWSHTYRIGGSVEVICVRLRMAWRGFSEWYVYGWAREC